LCVFCVRFFCFYIVSGETASRPKKRLMRTSLDKPLHVKYKVSKLAYRIWVILIANERVKKKVAPQLYSWGWVDPVPDSLLLRKCGSAGNRTRTSGSVTRISDH
jgi:hypothetical protein